MPTDLLLTLQHPPQTFRLHLIPLAGVGQGSGGSVCHLSLADETKNAISMLRIRLRDTPCGVFQFKFLLSKNSRGSMPPIPISLLQVPAEPPLLAQSKRRHPPGPDRIRGGNRACPFLLLHPGPRRRSQGHRVSSPLTGVACPLPLRQRDGRRQTE